jgi:hypothetical protein
METVMETVIDAKTTAGLLGVSVERVRKLCRDGRVVGAGYVGGVWIIPLPVEITLPKPCYRRDGAILPEFLAKRLPKPRPVKPSP